MNTARARRSARNMPEVRREDGGAVVRLIWWAPITDDPEQLVRLVGTTDVRTLARMYRAGLCREFADTLVRRLPPSRRFGGPVPRPRVEVDPIGLVRLVEHDRTRLLDTAAAVRLAIMCSAGGHDELAVALASAADAASELAKGYDA